MRQRIVFVVVVLALMSGCAISETEEIELGRKLHAEFEQQSGGIYPDPQIQQYVNGVGMMMARYAGRPNLQWQFRVVNSNSVNAFAVPGGYIYITQGLLFRLRNEAQLAGVLGHEAGHIEHRHSVKQIEKGRWAQGLTLVAGVAGAIFGVGGVGDLTGLAASLSLMKYGRDQERQADFAGLQYMTAAGYNPAGLVQMMEVLKASSGKRGGPEFLSTHPDPGNRLEYLGKAIQQKYADAEKTGTLGEQNFQQQVLTRAPAPIASVQRLMIDPAAPATWCGLCRGSP